MRISPPTASPAKWTHPTANSHHLASGLANLSPGPIWAKTEQKKARQRKKARQTRKRKPRPLPGKPAERRGPPEDRPLAGHHVSRVLRGPKKSSPRRPPGSVELQNRTWKHLGTGAPREFLKVPRRGRTRRAVCHSDSVLGPPFVTSVPFSL